MRALDPNFRVLRPILRTPGRRCSPAPSAAWIASRSGRESVPGLVGPSEGRQIQPSLAQASGGVGRGHEPGGASAGATLRGSPRSFRSKSGGIASSTARSRVALTPCCALRAPTKEPWILAKLAFCRSLITAANVSFGHQSMSFAAPSAAPRRARLSVAQALLAAFAPIAKSAALALPKSDRHALLADSRTMPDFSGNSRFGTVVTSPPYVNRMSYVRELRPYMYWLGYLAEARDAGELDWQAIGGTWGAATKPPWHMARRAAKCRLARASTRLVARIARQSDVLSRYVHKYFFDMLSHVRSIARVMARGGQVHYVVGNSKFFDVVVPVERLLAEIFQISGFRDATVQPLRKRSSKRELYEYLVSATKR